MEKEGKLELHERMINSYILDMFNIMANQEGVSDGLYWSEVFDFSIDRDSVITIKSPIVLKYQIILSESHQGFIVKDLVSNTTTIYDDVVGFGFQFVQHAIAHILNDVCEKQ